MKYDLIIAYLERHYNYIFRSNHPDDIELTKQLVSVLEMLKARQPSENKDE